MSLIGGAFALSSSSESSFRPKGFLFRLAKALAESESASITQWTDLAYSNSLSVTSTPFSPLGGGAEKTTWDYSWPSYFEECASRTQTCDKYCQLWILWNKSHWTMWFIKHRLHTNINIRVSRYIKYVGTLPPKYFSRYKSKGFKRKSYRSSGMGWASRLCYVSRLCGCDIIACVSSHPKPRHEPSNKI